MTLTLPRRFHTQLRNSRVESPVSHALRTVTDLVSDPTRALPFFPEYTDHGISHIQNVIQSSDFLIPRESFHLLTSEDISVLTGAILLHDIAMHLSDEQFLSLISERHPTKLISELDRMSWSSLWGEYIFKARHWDDHKLQVIFGNKSRLDVAQIIRPIEDAGEPDSWSNEYRKFIGEFIRQNHARMAHEFAVYGLPDADGERIPLLAFSESTLADIAGLIARSHNMPLRDTYHYLETRYHSRVQCCNTHPVYLMSVLRIADYIQVDRLRAPHISHRIRRLHNPYSERQWELHHSITEVRPDDADSLSLFVLASPKSINAFLDLQSLLADVQRELDNSWAVFGEVYSLQDRLRHFGLKLRRVRSNIDDVATFSHGVDYVPARFRFSHHPSLLTKLVGPLYGDHCEVAIRELLQNAIDAVREHARVDSAQKGYLDGSVSIWIRVWKEDDAAWFEIEDHGVGMNEEILLNLFLRAGSSFRDSDDWRKSISKDGRASVTRAGRFGVGVLAAFLLGPEVIVTTRHYSASADDGLTFTGSIDTNPIEVKRAVRHRAGTTIRIQLSDGIYDSLKQLDGIEWDWYRWSWPIVSREIDGNTSLPRLTRIPDSNSPLPAEWHRVAVDGYEEVLWTYGRAPRLVLNGINVGTCASSYGYGRQIPWEGDAKRVRIDWPIRTPFVSVHDMDAIFPVDLPRFGMHKHRFPFCDELIQDIAKDFAAFCLVFAPCTSSMVSGQSWQSPSYPGCAGDFGMGFKTGSWFYSLEGAGYVNRANLAVMQVPAAFLFVRVDPRAGAPTLNLRNGHPTFIGTMHPEQFHGEINYPAGLAQMMCLPTDEVLAHKVFFRLADGSALLMPADISERYLGYRSAQVDLTGINCREITHNSSIRMHLWTTGDADVDLLLEDIAAVGAVQRREAIYGCINRPHPKTYSKDELFDRIWNELIPSPTIPYDLAARHNAFSKAYSLLADYIDKWQHFKRGGQSELRRAFYRESTRNERL